jgi:hypothetical protein
MTCSHTMPPLGCRAQGGPNNVWATLKVLQEVQAHYGKVGTPQPLCTPEDRPMKEAKGVQAVASYQSGHCCLNRPYGCQWNLSTTISGQPFRPT